MKLIPFLLLGACLLASRLCAAPAFVHETSDLPVDPAARFGVLPNGMRYVIYPNKEPQGRAALRLLVQAGSLHEQEDQRGVAHFLEHMAFNGSRHYAPGSLVEFFQRMGMSFGGDTNAFTSFDRTQYLLELPQTDETTLAEGLRVFSDYAEGLLLLPEDIDQERGIILSEKRTRDTVAFRTFLAQFGFMLEGTLLPQRMPIGVEEVITHAPRERFTRFWDAWYRPERIAVVAVGDFDPAGVERLIVAAFSSFTARAPAPSGPELGVLPAFTGIRTHFHAEPEAPATTVSLTSLTPYVAEPDTAANRLRRLPRDLAVAMLNRRFGELAKKEEAPFSGAQASASEVFRFMHEASVEVVCRPGQWTAALAAGEQELRRALAHGFQPAELREVVAAYANDLDQAVKTAATRRSAGLADRIAHGLVEEEVFTHPADERAL